MQKADLDASFADRKAELDGAKAALEAFSADLPARRLEAAFAALAQGDTSLADAIFAEVAALEADGIDRAATADFQRGKLAEADIRWSEAAARYADAARLGPDLEHLAKAREFAGLTGDYPAALRLGDELIAAAIAEDGDGSGKHARGDKQRRRDADGDWAAIVKRRHFTGAPCDKGGRRRRYRGNPGQSGLGAERDRVLRRGGSSVSHGPG